MARNGPTAREPDELTAVQQPEVLAVGAEMLTADLTAQARRLAQQLKPQLAELDRRFVRHLARSGYDPRQRKALAAVTLHAAAALLEEGKPLEAFFEQVDYNGRRLAKLNLPPARTLAELEESGRMVAAVLGRAGAREAAALEATRRQLHLAVLLELNHAFYKVREAESDTLYALFRAELESRGRKELLERFLEILAGFCRAAAAGLYLLDHKTGAWEAAAAVGPQARTPAPGLRALQRKLGHPRYIRRGSRAEALLLDPQWRGRYESCWSIPILRGWRLEGVMQFGFEKEYEWLPRELQLLTLAAERLLEASEKARLAEELAAREAQVRELAARMMHIEEAERERISRELHDEAGQSLLCLHLQLEMLERRARGNPELRQGLCEARRLVERTIIEVRRLIADLSPSVLEHLGLPAALRRLLSRFRRAYPLQTRLEVAPIGNLPKQIQRVVYRLVQECCNNVGRHSSASHLKICLRKADEVLRLSMEDDGAGFDVQQALARSDSFGLAGMRERVELLGGRLEIRSRPGQGTRVLIELPIVGQEPAARLEALSSGQGL